MCFSFAKPMILPFFDFFCPDWVAGVALKLSSFCITSNLRSSSSFFCLFRSTLLDCMGAPVAIAVLLVVEVTALTNACDTC